MPACATLKGAPTSASPRADGRLRAIAGSSASSATVKASPSRIGIPGSPLPLDIEYAPRGCTLRYGGRVLARLAQGAERPALASISTPRRTPRQAKDNAVAPPIGGEAHIIEAVVWADLAGRSVRRVWSDGFEECFRRDAFGRLASHQRRDGSHAAWETHEFHYRGSELIEETTAKGWFVVISTRAAVLSPGGVKKNGDTTSYTYDARGAPHRTGVPKERRITSRRAGQARASASCRRIDRRLRLRRPGTSPRNARIRRSPHRASRWPRTCLVGHRR